MQQRCSLLDKKLKEIEGVNDLGSVDPRELSLVPDVVIPPKFKMPKFEKYDGTKCPENHLATYCNKMAGHARNEDLLIHVFYDSLTGAAAQWYRGLKKNQIRTWRDLARAFMGRYKYMMETAPDRLTLQNMENRPVEITESMLLDGKMRHQWSDHPSTIEKKIPCLWTLCPLHTMTCWS